MSLLQNIWSFFFDGFTEDDCRSLKEL